MALTDGDVAVLAEQAAGLLPVRAEVRISPAPADDPYRWGAPSWMVQFALGPSDGVGVRLEAAETPASALAHLLDQLSEYGSETRSLWGRAIPRCPDHPHPARVGVAGGEVTLTCPATGLVVERIRPDLPG